MYGAGRLLVRTVDRTMACYRVVGAPSARPQLLWTVSAVPRWRDQLLEDGPLPPPLRPPLPLAAHTARLTVLRADNR